jgi:hypothetical protein
MSVQGEFAFIAHCNADVPTVLELLDDVDGWSRWARPLIAQARWECWGQGDQGGPGAIRRLGAWPVLIRELILTRGPVGHTYTVIDPALFTRYLGSVAVRECPSGGVEVEWRVSFVARRSSMTRVLGFVLKTTIAGLLTRLTATAERRLQSTQATQLPRTAANRG